MFRTAAAAALLIVTASPAGAQVTITNDIPMAWQVPSGCLTGVRFDSEAQWQKSVCNRVELSTHEGSNNVRFLLNDTATTYITSTAAPGVVYALGFRGPGGTMIVAANGRCEITQKRILSCGAISEHNAVRVTHAASFLDGQFPEADAMLR